MYKEEMKFNSIADALFYYAGCIPNKLCYADEEREYSFAEVSKLVKNCAKYLTKIGIKNNDCIVVESTQDAKFLILGMACQVIGAIFVPLENKTSEIRCREIVFEVDAKLLISENQYDVSIDKRSLREILDCCVELEKEQLEITIDKEQTSEILYTTGTTGTPKGIMITNKNNVSIAENVIYGTEMKKNSVELILLPLSHSHALRSCYANMVNGSTSIIVKGITKVKEIFEKIEKYKITAMDISPSAVRILLKLSKGKFNEYKEQFDFIEIGTTVVDEEIKKELYQLFTKSRLYNSYGSTEAGRTCLFDFSKEHGKKGCIGKPTKHAKFIIVDVNRNEIKSSKENMGLIAVSGTMNMKGYWKDEERSLQVMENGYIYTNDVGYIDEDGSVYILGRVDDVITYRGIKISPEEIENVVLKYSEVVDCACVPVKDEICGQIPKVFVVVKDKGVFKKEHLIEFLSINIDSTRMPQIIQVIDEIPRSYNGKIQRKKLM